MEAPRADRRRLGRRRSGDEVPCGRASHCGVQGGAGPRLPRQAPRFRRAEGPAGARAGGPAAGRHRAVLAAPVHAEPRRRLGRLVGRGRAVPGAVLLPGQHRGGDLHLLLLPEAADRSALPPGRARAGARRRHRQRPGSGAARVRDRLHRLALVRPELAAPVAPLAHRQLGGQNILHLERPLAIPVHTYGILVAAGFLVAMALAARAAERSGLNRDKVLDLSFGILVAAMIGSRILFIIVNWDEYAHDLAGIFQFWKGGLVFYGGFIGAVLFSIWYMRRHDMQFLPYADAMGPTVAIGQALGRVGCFAAGCCWGGACDVHYPLAARFPPESLAYQSQVAARVIEAGAPSTISIHPTQLYEALGCALIFLFLTYWRSRKRFHGELLALYLMLYAPLRAVVET